MPKSPMILLAWGGGIEKPNISQGSITFDPLFYHMKVCVKLIFTTSSEINQKQVNASRLNFRENIHCWKHQRYFDTVN